MTSRFAVVGRMAMRGRPSGLALIYMRDRGEV